MGSDTRPDEWETTEAGHMPRTAQRMVRALRERRVFDIRELVANHLVHARLRDVVDRHVQKPFLQVLCQ